MKTRPRHHRDTPGHHPSNAKPRPTHHGDKTGIPTRHGREHEFFNLEASSVDIRATATWACPERCTIFKFKLEFYILPRIPIKMFINVHHQKIKTPSPKQKKTAQQHQRHNTKPSPTHHQNITAPSPHIKETSPKHARDVTNTSLEDPQNTTKKPTKQHQNNTETSPKKDRDKTETSQRHHQNHTETSPRQDQDKTETRPRHNRDITETSPRQDRDKTKTRPRQGSIIRRHTGHSILPQLHWFAQRSTIYKFKLEF